MFDRIIVGIDGSAAANTAAEFAFNISKHFEIPVVGIHVIDNRLIDESFIADIAGVLGFTYYEGMTAKIREFLEKQGNTFLDHFAKEGSSRGIRVSVMQTSGSPYKEIVNQADVDDIIVVGKIGRRPLKGVFLGSNSEKIARLAKCTVVLIPESMKAINRVLIGYDGCRNSKKALSVAVELRKVFQYEIHVIVVKDDEKHSELLKDELDSVLGEDYIYNFFTGLPEERIVSFCKDNEIDMLFLGAYGKGRIKEFFLGSVTSFIIHNLDIPIVLTRDIKD